MYPSIFHISSRFFATGFRSFRNFFKVWSPIENYLEEIRKIEGYTRDVESSKVTYFRFKEPKIIKISHFQAIAWRFWAQEERKSVCNFLLSLEMDQNAQNMIILFKKDFVLFPFSIWYVIEPFRGGHELEPKRNVPSTLWHPDRRLDDNLLVLQVHESQGARH